MTRQRVAVIVGCGNSKEDNREVAWKMYSSTYFEKKWAAASVIGHPYIVSGKYGLLSVNDRIDPYSETWKDLDAEETRSRAEEVVDDLPDQYDTVVLLAGRDYVNPLTEALEKKRDVKIHDPFKNTSGNGEQMEWCDEVSTLESVKK